MRVLLSAMSCNASIGSDGLVGYMTAKTLAREHEVTMIASPPVEVPPGVEWIPCDAQPVNFNEVGADAWLRFEWRQWRLVRRLRAQRKFDVIHKLTPAPLVNTSLLHLHRLPLITGPIVVGQPVPSGFDPIALRPMTPSPEFRYHPARIKRSLVRRMVNAISRRQPHIRHASLILLGMKAAIEQVPEDCRGRCQFLTWAGVEHETFVPGPARERRGPLTLLFVGRLVPYKGVELLLRALHIAAKEEQFSLKIVGGSDPVYADFIRNLAVELGLQKTVEFVPPVPRDQLVRVYQDAHVFCFPTLSDQYGVALLEAMSCGCAPLVTDASGPQEIVADGTGIRIPQIDPEQYVRDYSAALLRLARDRELCEELGRRARQHILAVHDWERIGGALLGIYRNAEADLRAGRLPVC
jgi:glycosyltransferase involved in cell wall biosynthesis